MMLLSSLAIAGDTSGGYQVLQKKKLAADKPKQQWGLQANHAGRVMAPEKATTPDELAAARGMEQMMVNLMIEEMRKSVPENEVVPLSQGERIFRNMLDQEHARMLSEAGTLGIADLVLDQMHGKR